MDRTNTFDFNRLVTRGVRMSRSLCACAMALAVLAGLASAQHEGHDHGHDHGHKDAHGAESKPHEPSSPFEWGGVYDLPSGVVELVIQPGPDASIDIALLALTDNSVLAFDAASKQAETVFEGKVKLVEPDQEFTPGLIVYQLRVEQSTEMRFKVRLEEAGRFALYTQHFADEFQTVFMANGRKIHPASSKNFVERFGQITILPDAMKAFDVKLEPAVHRTLMPSFTAPARVAFNAELMAHVGSPVAGRAVAISARLGDLVKAGDPLMTVESLDLGAAQIDYLEKRQAAKIALPLADLAKQAAERAKRIFDESQGITLTEVQRRVAERLEAESAVAKAEAAVVGALNRLRLLAMSDANIKALEMTGIMAPNHVVRAPISGRIIRRDLTLGENLRPDRDSLFVIADTSQLWVYVHVPELRLNEVTVGSPVRISVPAVPGLNLEGTVGFIGVEVADATRTTQVRVDVSNVGGLLRPGMFATARVMGTVPSAMGDGESEGVLAVPDSAIQMIEGKPVVFVPLAEKPNTFLKRPVTLGEAVGGLYPVRFGLREGDPIVVSGSFILKAQLGKSTAKHEH